MPRRDVDSPTHRRVLALLREHGVETVSFQSLETGLSHWFEVDDEGVDRGCVAYTDTGGAWVATGPPITAPTHVAACAADFAAAARAAGRRARIFGVTTDELGEQWSLVHMGEEPVWNPGEWHATKASKRSLREQLRRARAKGVRVRRVEIAELAGEGATLRRKLDALCEEWLASRKMAPMTFAVHLEPYGAMGERRVFIAERGEALVGFLSAVPVYKEGGWFFEDLIRSRSAPNGTAELLFDQAMESVAAEGSGHATFGLAPLANTPSSALAWIRDHTEWLYQFEGIRRFKAKFSPAEWRPVYLAHPSRDHGARAIFDLLRAFAGGSLLAFGASTLARRTRELAQIAAALMVPWIILLTLLDDRWFPHAACRWGWVGFDTALAFGLFELSRNWSKSLCVGLIAAAFADTALGALQLALHTRQVASTPLQWGFIAAALGAPLGLGALLWLDLRRRR